MKFRRFLSLLLSFCLILSIFPLVNVSAATSGSCGAGVTWSFDAETGTLTISGNGRMTDYEGRTQAPWIDLRDKVSTLIVEEGVTHIGAYAFAWTGSIVSLGNTPIISSPSDTLKHVQLPSTLESIGRYAFWYCNGLTAMPSAPGLKTMDLCAFSSCLNMTEVVLPEGLQSIGESAFTTCQKLTSVTIPRSLRFVSVGAFNYCSKLQTVYADNLSDWCAIDFDGIWANPCSFGASLYMGEELVKDLVIPDGVEKVGKFQFYGCGSLVSVDFPKSVTAIESTAFEASSVQRVALPSNIKTVGSFAFCGCKSLSELTIEEGLQSIGQYAFSGCSSLKELILPDSLQTMVSYCFQNCTALEQVRFPIGLTDIPAYAFYECRALRELDFPETLKNIGSYGFYNCDALTSVTFPESVYSIGYNCFGACSNLELAIFLGDETYPHDHRGTFLEHTTLHGGVDSGARNYSTKYGLPFSAHDYVVTDTQEVGCAHDGIVTRTCTICSHDRYTTTPLTGHAYSYTIADGLANCECANCGDNLQITPSFFVDSAEVAIDVYGGYAFYAFVPEFTEHHTLTFSADAVNIAKLHGFDGTLLTQNAGSRYTMSAELTAGETYILALCLKDPTQLGNLTVRLRANHNCVPQLTTAPTCTEDGEWTYLCDCGYFYTQPAAATGHNYIPEVIEPTCLDGGRTTYTCENCGDSYLEDVTEALGHEYQREVTEPTCTEGGYTTFTCAVCGDSYVDEHTAPKGHPYSAIITSPTCTDGGYTTFVCPVCGDSYVAEHTAPHGHPYDAVITEPTCLDGGYTTYTCPICGDVYIGTDTPPKGHAYDVKVTEPTCTEFGYTLYTCTVCGESHEGEPTAPKGHSYRAETTEPTCTDGGYTVFTCTVCGDSYTAEETAPYCPSAHFVDVAGPKDWSHKGIDFAVKHGLFSGMSATTFEPETAMTRAMLVTVLWRYAGKPIEGKNSFTDVPNGQWYSDAVTWAAHNGIVAGVGNNKFDPEGKITREQMAAILFRYANKVGFDTSKRATLSFPDANKVSGYAKDALQWAVAEGLVSGSKEGNVTYLHPQGNATRAQVASILMRFIENVAT